MTIKCAERYQPITNECAESYQPITNVWSLGSLECAEHFADKLMFAGNSADVVVVLQKQHGRTEIPHILLRAALARIAS